MPLTLDEVIASHLSLINKYEALVAHLKQENLQLRKLCGIPPDAPFPQADNKPVDKKKES